MNGALLMDSSSLPVATAMPAVRVLLRSPSLACRVIATSWPVATDARIHGPRPTQPPGGASNGWRGDRATPSRVRATRVREHRRIGSAPRRDPPARITSDLWLDPGSRGPASARKLGAFSQIDESLRRESLRPIALLRLEPQAFTERYGILFRTDTADAESTLAALIELADGRQYMLLRNVDAPSAGTELLAAETSRYTANRDLEDFLHALRLDRRTVTWTLETNP